MLVNKALMDGSNLHDKERGGPAAPAYTDGTDSWTQRPSTVTGKGLREWGWG